MAFSQRGEIGPDVWANGHTPDQTVIKICESRPKSSASMTSSCESTGPFVGWLTSFGEKTLLNTIRKILCKIINDEGGETMEKEQKISKGQAGLSPNHSSVDHGTWWVRLFKEGLKNAELPTTVTFWTYRRPMTQHGETGCEERCGKLGAGVRCGECWKNITDHMRNAMMPGGEISRTHQYFTNELHNDVPYRPLYSSICWWQQWQKQQSKGSR